MSDAERRKYRWYKHHAWGALALLSIFIAINNFYIDMPRYISLSVVSLLCLYALVAIFFTYRHNKENIAATGDKGPEIVIKDDTTKKNLEKLEKKRLKVEAKKIKKRNKD